MDPTTPRTSRPPPLPDLLDAELRAQGTTLSAWAASFGLTADALRAMVAGLRPAPPEVLHALAERVGVATSTLARAAA